MQYTEERHLITQQAGNIARHNSNYLYNYLYMSNRFSFNHIRYFVLSTQTVLLPFHDTHPSVFSQTIQPHVRECVDELTPLDESYTPTTA